MKNIFLYALLITNHIYCDAQNTVEENSKEALLALMACVEKAADSEEYKLVKTIFEIKLAEEKQEITYPEKDVGFACRKYIRKERGKGFEVLMTKSELFEIASNKLLDKQGPYYRIYTIQYVTLFYGDKVGDSAKHYWRGFDPIIPIPRTPDELLTKFPKPDYDTTYEEYQNGIKGPFNRSLKREIGYNIRWKKYDEFPFRFVFFGNRLQMIKIFTANNDFVTVPPKKPLPQFR